MDGFLGRIGLFKSQVEARDIKKRYEDGEDRLLI